MSIPAFSRVTAVTPIWQMTEAKEGPGPDHDRDADNECVGAPANCVSATAPQGMGTAVIPRPDLPRRALQSERLPTYQHTHGCVER